MSRTVQAPPWLARLFTPLIARYVAQQMAREHPDLTPQQIGEMMRAEIPAGADPAACAMVDAVVARLPSPGVASGEAAAATPKLSAILLVAANLAPLYGVLFMGWEVFPLLVLFWAENVVVGMLNALRMLCVDPDDPVGWGTKLLLVPFFCFHYGVFTATHGIFLLSGMFGGKRYRVEGGDPTVAMLAAFRDLDLWLPAAFLAASHLASFLWNYLYGGEYLRADIRQLMRQPYARVIVLHVTIIIGGLAVMALGSPVWALVLLLALKVGVDLAAHLREHRGAG